MNNANKIIPSWQALIQVFFLELRRHWKQYCFIALILCTLMALFIESGHHYLRQWQEKATGQAISSLEADENDNGRREGALAPPQVLKGLRVLVISENATAKEQAEIALRQSGAYILDGNATGGDIALTLVDARGAAHWEMHSEEIMSLMSHRRNIQVILNNHASEVREALTDSLPVDAREQRVYLNEDTARNLRRDLGTRMEATIVYLPLIFIIYFLMMFSGSVNGIEWDTRRAQGSLEAWALTPHGPWVLYGGEILARAAWASIVALLLGSVLFAYGSLDLILVVALGAFAFSGVVFISMWGMLATMLFHHRYGRMFGRLALSPAVFTIITLVRLTFITSFASVLVANEAYKVGEQATPHAISLGLFFLGGCLLIGALILVPIVEWRIGARRMGLRKL